MLFVCAPALAQDSSVQAEEVVVQGRRSGVPVWRIGMGDSQVVVAGSLDEPIAGTKVELGPLLYAMRRADRVLYPSEVRVRINFGTLFKYGPKLLRQRSLPKSRPLDSMITPALAQRLDTLATRGQIDRKWRGRHPFHLAMDLHERSAGKGGFAPSLESRVRAAAKREKIPSVLNEKTSADTLLAGFFGRDPAEDVPCLAAMTDLVDRYPDAQAERSRAWTERRVVDVLDSPVQQVYRACWQGPGTGGRNQRIADEIATLAQGGRITLAVVDIGALARRGGILDTLAARGIAIEGPRWKR